MQGAVTRLLSGPNEVMPPADADRQRFVELLIMAVPPAAGVLATITNTLNLWLAARIVRFSGRLNRTRATSGCRQAAHR